MTPDNSPLFTPVRLGSLALPHRVLMAPMTRNRATGDGRATALMATYYAQRAAAGLIVSEMTQISPAGRSYLNTPGLTNDAEVQAWRMVTGEVHRVGGRIVVQIAHGGRASHPSLLPHGRTPVAPSAIAPEGTTYTAEGPRPFVTPRALETTEIHDIVRQFADATRRARDAGFDGVEIHAANGYLIDQFLRDGSNRRVDRYGGSALNRMRFLLEVVDAVTGTWDAAHVGVRLSPFNAYNSMSDSDPEWTFSLAARVLRPFGLAYLHVVEPATHGAPSPLLTPRLREQFAGPVILNGSLSPAAAAAAVARGDADAISFGAAFIANPDLPARIAAGVSLARADQATFYTGGARGYIDYPPQDRVA